MNSHLPDRDESSPAQHTHPLLGLEHPQREELADEVHARPSEALQTPCRATFVAKLIDRSERRQEIEHLAALCLPFSVDPPPADANHFTAALGPLKFKWERHGEFSGYTFIVGGRSPEPFSEPAVMLLTPGWLAAIPGRILVAAHAKVVTAPDEGIDAAFLARHFGGHLVVGGDVGERAGMAYTDFRVGDDGFSRFLLIDCDLTPRQAGRMLQRLLEIETYRMMALLALPMARQQSARLAEIETSLASVTTDIASATATTKPFCRRSPAWPPK